MECLSKCQGYFLLSVGFESNRRWQFWLEPTHFSCKEF